MNTRTWFKAAGIRAIKTAAQTALASIGTTAALDGVDWGVVGGVVGLSFVASWLTSIVGLPEAGDAPLGK